MIGIGIGIGQQQRVGGVYSPVGLFAGGGQGLFLDATDSGTMGNDKSGNGNNVALSNATFATDGGGLGYISFNGTTSVGVTGSINFSGTSKITIFAGVRKLTNTAGMIAELNAAPAAGTFRFFSDANFNCVVQGGTSDAGRRTNGPAGDNKSVVTGLLDTAGASTSDAVNLRRNGALDSIALTGTTGGGGNFGNYVLYIGRRGGSSVPFSGHIYSLIIVGRLCTSEEIAATEAWMAARCGVTL